MTTSNLTLQLSPMQFSAGPRRAAKGANLAFKRASAQNALVVGGTESHWKTRLFKAIPRKAKKHGYAAKVHRYGLWLAVNKDLGRVVDRGFEPVLAAKRVSPRLGGHQPRGIYWVEVESGDFGTVVVAIGHWLTKRPDTAERRAENRAYTDAFEDLLKRKGKGMAIGFLMGDTNDEDDKNEARGSTQDQLDDDFETCWDDVGRWPATNEGGTTIDVIARRHADRRVKSAHWAVSWGNPFKDHGDTLARYRVKVLRRS